MPSQTLLAGAAANVTRDVGDTAWSNPGNAVGDTDAEASAAPLLNGGKTQWLRSTTYGFAIPSGATITGILAEMQRRADFNNRFYDNGLILVTTGVGSTNKSTGAAYSTTLTYMTYGGDGDLWGLAWTPSMVNDVNFGMQFAGTRSGNAVTGFVRRLRITVYYTESDTTPPISNITSTTNTKISAHSDSVDVTWTSDEDFVSYQLRVVPLTTSAYTEGTLIEQDQNPAAGGTAATPYTSTITYPEITAAAPGGGIVKLFTRDAAGNWSS